MKKSIGMFAAVALALAMTGVGFAHWEESLWVEGTVETGELDLEILDASISSDTTKEWETGSVPDLSVALEDGPDSEPVGCDVIDMSKLIVEARELCPCMTITVEATIRNNGTIPAYNVGMSGAPTSDLQNLDDCLTITQVPGPIGQIDPGQEATLVLAFHVEQCAPECAVMVWEGQLDFVNWNEVEVGSTPA